MLQHNRSSSFIVPHVFHPYEIDKRQYSDILHLTKNTSCVFSGEKSLLAEGSFFPNACWPEHEVSTQSTAIELMYIMGAGKLNISGELSSKSDTDLLELEFFQKDPNKVSLWAESTEKLLMEMLSQDNQVLSVTVKPIADFHKAIFKGQSFYLNFGVLSQLRNQMNKRRVSPKSLKAVFSGAVPAAGKISSIRCSNFSGLKLSISASIKTQRTR